MISFAEVREWPDELLAQILTSLRSLSADSPHPYIALDADGTLWSGDAGENFFAYQIKTKQMRLPERPFEHYQNLKKQGPAMAYLWLAQICAGLKLSEVEQAAYEAFTAANQSGEIQPFKSVYKLIEQAFKLNIDVFVVTASVGWAVEPGAVALGIPKQNVLGVRTQIKDGVITTKQDGPITWRAGKVEALYLRNDGVRPLFACGNSDGDIDLLKFSSGLSLAVNMQTENEKLNRAEAELAKLAIDHGWLTHKYR